MSEFLFPLWLPPGAEEFSIEKLAALFPRIDQKYTSFVRTKYPEITLQQIRERAGNTADNLVKHFSETILIVGHEASVVGAVQGLIIRRLL
mgnify:FL=1